MLLQPSIVGESKNETFAQKMKSGQRDVFIVEHLGKKYGKNDAVKDVSFSIRENEIFGMVGPNGAGKTTAIECSLGIRKRDFGKVQILGKDPLIYRNKVFSQVGVQLQETSYPDKARVHEICSLMSVLYVKPLPYELLLKEFDLYDKRRSFISDLSGGQRQRLAIILALLPDPKIVVFDELTTGLDPLARHSMWNHILNLKKRGITVLLSTHFMEEAQVLCDRIAVFVGGTIKKIDLVENIIASCALKSHLIISSDPGSLAILMEKLPGKINCQFTDETITIIYENTHSLLEIVRIIDENALSIVNLTVKTPTLEDAYLSLTSSTTLEALS